LTGLAVSVAVVATTQVGAQHVRAAEVAAEIGLSLLLAAAAFGWSRKGFDWAARYDAARRVEDLAPRHVRRIAVAVGVVLLAVGLELVLLGVAYITPDEWAFAVFNYAVAALCVLGAAVAFLARWRMRA
jgi:hypothetical protein